MVAGEELRAALRRYWGYENFRPMQEKVTHALLAGQDACVVMPTGGGKSLCYQLPAAVQNERTVVVISPLIALMQDQVAQLAQMGIPAAVLNSTQPWDEQSQVMRGAAKGEYRLLYLSPERIARDGTIEWLRRVPLSLFAIDEAHCISEWGHEFRPDYRELRCLRQGFSSIPIAAFTASATRQVRHDIVRQLQLRNPLRCIASFHRRNLRYVVRACDATSQPKLLLQAMRHYDGANVIVYAPTIARVEETVDRLQEQGIEAIPYHGKMDAETRRQNQERWMSDEVRVLVGTIAFGLGINKASVRAVIHLALPKSIEQYYQEAGRAGRDGEPADCVLLWQERDTALLAYFAKQIEDREEQKRAWQRYHDIQGFVESDECRHRQICLHFGETPKWESCESCDVCGVRLSWLSGTSRSARKPDVPGTTANAPSRRERPATEGPPVNPELREYLREWRRNTTKEMNLKAFMVMHDTALDELCRRRPASLDELRRVPGFGERKTQLFGPAILDALARFGGGARVHVAMTPRGLPAPSQETARLLGEGRSFAEIAEIRGRQVSTVVAAVANLVEQGQVAFQDAWVDAGRRKDIREACSRLGLQRLKPIQEALGPEVTMQEIHLVVAQLRHMQSSGKSPGAGESSKD